MDEKIKQLKDLSLIYKVALGYDCVPSLDEETIEDIIDYIGFNVPIELLEKYEGWSPSNIENEVFNLIDEL